MKKEIKNKIVRNARRTKRIRNKILAAGLRPRLTVFRSNKYIYAQVIDKTGRETLVSASEKDIENKKLTKTERAQVVGKNIAKLAIEKKINEVVFDKGGYRYHGRVKVLAEAAREGGLQF